MATVSYRVDDLDGKSKVTDKGQDTTITLNGRTVSIDLSDKSFDALTDLLAPYFEKGTEVTVKSRKGNDKTDGEVANAEARNTAIRTWAGVHGVKVAERGRIAGDVQRKYDAWVAEQDAAVASTNGQTVNA